MRYDRGSAIPRAWRKLTDHGPRCLVWAAVMVVLMGAATATRAQEPLVINEVFYETSGFEVTNWLELKGEAGTSLDGLELVAYASNGSVRITINLDGLAMPSDGYFVISQGLFEESDLVIPTADLPYASGSIVLQTHVGAVVDAVGYGAVDWHTSPYFHGEGMTALGAAALSIGRCPDGVDTGNNAADFRRDRTPTPGASNDACSDPVPEAAEMCAILAESSDGSPVHLTDYVEVTGVCVVPKGVVDVNQSFRILDPETGCGLMVFDYFATAGPVHLGEVLRVSGTIGSWNGLVELLDPIAISVLGHQSVEDIHPLAVTTQELAVNGHLYENRLIQLRNVALTADSQPWPYFLSPNTSRLLTVDDGSGPVTVTIDSDTNIDQYPGPTGVFDVTGFGHQYDSTLPLTAAYQLLPSSISDFSHLGSISGFVFLDLDGNCVRDDVGTETGLAGVQVVLYPVGLQATTDAEGRYEFGGLLAGAYEVQVGAIGSCAPSCDRLPVTLASQERISDGDLAMTGLADLRTYFSEQPMVPGFDSWISLQAENHGASSNVELTLDLPRDENGVPGVTLLDATPGYTYDSANARLTWNVWLGMNQTRTLSASVRTTAAVGTMETARFSAVTAVQDCDPSDNEHVWTSVVVGSRDPNDKLVSPPGGVDAGSRLDYQINFQNVGTYPTSFVTIADTLDANLDLATLEIGPSGHPYALQFQQDGRVLTWTFWVDLPCFDPESPDYCDPSYEPYSHGFVTYSIRTLPDLPDGTTISNRASIVFDYNEPLVTNTVVTTIGSSGSVAGLVRADCPGPDTAVNGVEVRAFAPGGTTAVAATATDASGAYALYGLPSGSYTIRMTVPAGYTAAESEHDVTVASSQPANADFSLHCLPGSVAGRVLADCPEAGTGLGGVQVDAFLSGTGHLAASVVTEEDGAYEIADLLPGAYVVTVVTPLGYVASSEEVITDVTAGATAAADLGLTCVEITADPRSIGFWKHQVGVATGGNGSAEISGEMLCGYLDLIQQHFNDNSVNPVVVYLPPQSGAGPEKLLEAKRLLNLRGSAAMIDRARQQLMALLFNVASGKIAQQQLISLDGRTVSQAITYCDQLIDSDGGDYELAKTIADLINNSQGVPRYTIPEGVNDITYSSPTTPAMSFGPLRSWPNPGTGPTTFTFRLEDSGPVRLEVYDVAGRLIALPFSGELTAGGQIVQWDGRTLDGAEIGSGVFFSRLSGPGGRGETIKLLMVDR